MISILCYGDSNTWGTEPGTGLRYPPDVRWPGVLQRCLGAGYLVIEEGLGGRTTAFNDPVADYKNGREYLIPCLDSHQPLGAIVIMLGTNDVQTRFSASAIEIAWGAEALLQVARKWAPVVLVAPPPLGMIPSDEAGAYAGAAEKIRELPRCYQRVAQEMECLYFDAGTVVKCSDIDGTHLDAGAHAQLGEAIAGFLLSVLPAASP